MASAPDTLPDDLLTLKPETLLAIRDRAKCDKLYLATAILGYDSVAEVHQELFDQLIPYEQSKPWAEQSKITKRLILWSRGHYKSTAIVVEMIQAILNFPNIRILLMQGSTKTTRRLLREVASHFTGGAGGSRLADIFPEFCTAKEKNPKKALQQPADSFITPARTQGRLQQATVTVASPRSVKTGQHYDLGVFDDLVNDQNYRSQTLLEKTREDFYMALPLLDPPFYVIVTGTRYAHGDLYDVIIRSDAEVREWTISIRTCWREEGVPRFLQQKDRNGRFIGFTREGLLKIQRDDPAIYMSQYMLQPVSAASQSFDEAMLESRLLLPDTAPKTLGQPVMFVDLASGGERADDCVILLATTDHLGKVYVTFGRGGKWDTATLASHILDVMFRVCDPLNRPAMVYFEKSAAGKVFVDYLRMFAATRGVTLPLDFLPADNQADAKRIRVSALLGYFKQDRLFFFRGLECWPRMLDQFVKWTGDKGQSDDYPDTVALAALYFATNVALLKPLSAERFPFLKAIESAPDLAMQTFAPDQGHADTNTMGDWFAC